MFSRSRVLHMNIGLVCEVNIVEITEEERSLSTLSIVMRNRSAWTI